MLRVQRKIFNSSHLKVLQRVQQQRQRCLSQQAGRKSGIGAGTVIVTTASGVTLGVLGLVGYASWSDENRKLIDDNVPGAQMVTDTLLGAVPLVRRPAPPPLVIPPPPSFTKPATPAPAPAKQATPKEEQADKLVNKTVSEDKKTEEKKPQVEKASSSAPPPPAASSSVDSIIRASSKAVTAALDAAERAAAVVQEQGINAIRLAEKGGLDDKGKAAVAAAIQAAEQAFLQAQKDMTELATHIACSRSSGSNQESLFVAERAMAELGPAAVKVQGVIDASLNTMLNVELLCRNVETARKRLAAELEDVLPSIATNKVEQEAQLLLSHACHRITGLEKIITEKHKALEEIRAKGPSAVDVAGGISESSLQAELDKLRHQLTLQHRSDLGRQQDELEAEVRGQLKRQSAAHSEHLSDELTKQDNAITAAWQVKLYDQINREKDIHFRDMSAIRGRLLGLQSAVTARADADRAAHAARQLWLACQSLRNALRLGREDANSWDEQLQPLAGHLTAVRVAAGTDEFVHGIVGTVGSVAAERGVYTEEALRHRFMRVATVARRVAMVPENGGSLLRYLLSYVQSLLLVQASQAPTDAELLDQPFDIHALSTFDIIDRARASLAADDLLTGVRWINQLTGESRRVAHDWCEEARRTLELRQAVDALMAHAAATTATAL